MRKRREACGDSSIRTFIGGVYKTSHKLSEFVARLFRTREESLSIVVFKNGVITEIAGT